MSSRSGFVPTADNTTLAGKRVSLRPLAEDDLPLIEEWHGEAAALACGGDAARAGRLADRVRAGGLLAVCRAEEPKPLGVVEYRPPVAGGACALVPFIALEAGQRGRGFGSEAVRLLEGGRGAKCFRAAVSVRNGLALYFWLRLGYRPLPPDTNGKPDIIWMVRDSNK